jgi:hypothetical protein
MTGMTRRRRWPGCLGLVLGGGLCAAAAALAGEVTPVPGGPHAVHSARIQRLMQRLNDHAQSQGRPATDPQRTHDLAALAEVAWELAATARSLDLDSAGAANADRVRFVQLSDAFAGEAAALARLAAVRDYEGLPAQYERLMHACAPCHAAFRPAARAPRSP